MTPIGVLEALQKIPYYSTSCEVVSMQAEMMRVRIDYFVKQICSNAQTMSVLEKMCEEVQNNLTKRVLNQSKIRKVVAKKFNFLAGEKNTEWQYCPVEKLIQQKEEYDKWVSWQKLENATVNKFDSFTGQPFPGTEKGSTDQFGRRKESTHSLYDMAADQEKESSQEESPEKVRYEPHLIEADSRGQIRGIFRMNPKFDPSCKVIKDPRPNTK